MIWQLQEAKQRFSQVVKRALEEGPQIVTRHGEESVVIVAATEYRQLVRKAGRKSFKEHLLAAPLEGIEIERAKDTGRPVDL
jgi:prevent-host-death family protein